MEPRYADLVGRTIGEGLKIPSRYGMTFERRNVTVASMAGEWPRRPMLNPKIGFMEGLFLVGCFFDLDRIIAVAPKADHSLFTMAGAYGPRIQDQLHKMVRMMAQDPEGRQHILYIGAAGDQYRSDTPCTNSLQFLVRQGFINCVVTMRSSDIIKGLPTDMIQFGLLTQVLAICLGLIPGVVAINAVSSHMYQLDMDKAPSTMDTSETRRFSVPVLDGLVDLDANARLIRYQDWSVEEAFKAPWENYSPVEVK